MSKIWVGGGIKLHGSIAINGSKNSALAIIAAALLPEEPVTLHNVPNIDDISTMCSLLSSAGSNILFELSEADCGHSMTISSKSLSGTTLDNQLAKSIRASLLLLPPLLARCGTVIIGYPGGCRIGHRPIDMHIMALTALGASFEMKEDCIIAKVDKFIGNNIILEKISVGATESAVLAAVIADGKTTIHNAAIEPEVCDLLNFLLKCGAKISGIGTRVLTIRGVKSLHGCSYTVAPDRVEAGTYMLAAIMTGGKLEITGINHLQISCISEAFTSAGGLITPTNNGLMIEGTGAKPMSLNISTNPHPHFPSDMQAQFMAAMCIANSVSIIEENVFENRFMHVAELQKMGANIALYENKAIVRGVDKLSGSNISSTDLRASAALLLAALSAETESIIDNIFFLRRGYEKIESKLRACGAQIKNIDD